MNLHDVPTVPGANLWGHAHLFKDANRLSFLRSAANTGELAQVRFLGRHVLTANSPATAHEILVEKARFFEKSPGIRLLLYYLAGEGLFTSEGDLWRRQRRLMAPLFHPGAIAQYTECMHDVAVRAASTWSHGSTVDLAHEMTRITMGIVGKALFDSDTFDDTDALGAALTTCLQWVNAQSSSPQLVTQVALIEMLERAEGHLPSVLKEVHKKTLNALVEPRFLPGARSEDLQRAVRVLDENIQKMIDERRTQGMVRNDLLTRLLTARDEENAGVATMSDKQVRDEANTLFVAGHETTATALAWVFYLLGRNAAVREAVQREADALPTGPISFTTASKELPIATRVFKEAMRLYPPVIIYARRSLADTEIRGYSLPKGTILFVSPYPIHHAPDVYPDPDTFDPDRFLPEREAARPKSAYIPFGAGPRVCIGMHFAMLEGPIVLATLLRHARIETDPTRVVVPEVFATLRPKGGVSAQVYRRA
jgi:cytochrome P450